METMLGDAPAKVLRGAYAWVDPEGDPGVKASYKFIHHVLNGARGGANLPDGDRRGIHRHLARHLRDAGEEPAALKEI